jgi:hypothetical protein
MLLGLVHATSCMAIVLGRAPRVRPRSDVSKWLHDPSVEGCDAYGWLPAVCFGGAWSRIAFSFL